MRFQLVLASIALGLSGCAHLGPDQQGCWTDECREFELRRAATEKKKIEERKEGELAEKQRQKERAERADKIADCRATIQDQSAGPDARSECVRWLSEIERAEIQERWEASGVTCLDRRLDERHISVACDLPNRPGGPDMASGNEKMFQLAAFAALSAGKSFFIFTGREPVSGSFSESKSPVECEEKNRGLRALAAGLAAMGPDATSNCSTSMGNTYCETRVRQRPELPPPEFDCKGGDVTRTLLSAKTVEYFELLTAQEAAARDNPDLPAWRRPFSAASVSKVYSGLR